MFGPPGVGKGSYCKLMSRDLGLKTISSGEMFRKWLEKEKTEAGREIEI